MVVYMINKFPELPTYHTGKFFKCKWQYDSAKDMIWYRFYACTDISDNFDRWRIKPV